MTKFLKNFLSVLTIASLISGAAVFAVGCNPDDTPNTPPHEEDPEPAPTLDQISVSLADAAKTQEYKPSDDFKEGYYVFRSVDTAFTLTDGESVETASFTVSGYNSVLVYYTANTVYDIGTTSSLNFNLVFSKLETDGKTTESAHKLETNLAVVLNLEADESVYLRNPDELSIMGQRGGYPLHVSGENYSVTVGNKEHASPFLLAGGKDVKVEKASGANGAVVLYFNDISNAAEITVGNAESLQIELLERTITGTSGKTTSLLWSTGTAKFSFTAENAGDYKITLTSGFASDKMSVSNIVSLSSIVPEKVSSNVSDSSNENDFTVAMGNPYIVTYRITEDNISEAKGRSKTFNVEFESGGDFSSLTEGQKITYTILVEYIG